MRSWYLALLREAAGPPASVDLPPGRGAFDEEGDNEITEEDVRLDVVAAGAPKSGGSGAGAAPDAAAPAPVPAAPQGGAAPQSSAAPAPLIKKPKEKV
jgi:hypothetical protein